LELAPDEAIAHWKWGLVLEFDDDFSGAEAEFNNAITLEPHASMPRESMGILLMREGKTSQAMEYFRTAVALNPGAVSHFNYGVALEKTGDVVGAVAEYQAAVAADAHLADAQFNLANILMTHEQRPDQAIPHFEAALADRPNRYDYHFNYASALRAFGRVPEARAQCRIVLQLNPGFAPAEQLLNATGGM
jgi:tetratricopeptide (TPR) repeat protein